MGTRPGGDPRRSQVCIPNISQKERRKRLAAGVVQFAVSLVVLGMLLAAGADRGWRFALVLPFWGAAAGFFQWRDKT
jgi:hypothetical protein